MQQPKHFKTHGLAIATKFPTIYFHDLLLVQEDKQILSICNSVIVAITS